MPNTISKDKRQWMLGKQGSIDSQSGDEAALEALYTSTNGASWTNNTGWGGSGMDLSNNIYGVTTETIDGELRVTRIKLNGTTGYESGTPYVRGVDGTVGGNNLTGTLPPEIGNLRKCEYFNVKQNALDTTLPAEIQNMESIVRLLLNGRLDDLYNNDNPNYNKVDPTVFSNILKGEIPEFTNCTNLRFLEIVGKANDAPDRGVGVSGRLTGGFPTSIGNTSLNAITAGFNAIDNLPSEMSTLDIHHLFIKGNAFLDQSFPDIVSGWTNFRSIEISRCGFAGAFPDLSNSSMRNVWASANNFTSGWPHYFFDGSMPNINTMEMAFNNDWAPNFPNNKIDIVSPNNLKSLTMDGLNLDGISLGDISSVSTMINFGFGWSDLAGPLPDFSGFTNFRYLRFPSTQINGKLPYTIGNITSGSFRQMRFDFAGLSSYEIGPNNHGAIAPVILDGNGDYVSGLKSMRDMDFEANAFSQADLDNIILDLEALIQSRKGTDYEVDAGLTKIIDISSQTTGSILSNTTEINNAITYIQNEGWTITT